jgi:hypothetical protein
MPPMHMHAVASVARRRTRDALVQHHVESGGHVLDVQVGTRGATIAVDGQLVAA